MAEEEAKARGLSPNPAEESAALKWVRDKWGDDPPCPYCKGTEWGVIPARAFRVDGGKTEPMYSVVCLGCGNTVLLESRFQELREQSSK